MSNKSRVYRPVSIYDLFHSTKSLSNGRRRVEAVPYLPVTKLSIPKLDRYGTNDLSNPDLKLEMPDEFVQAARDGQPIILKRTGGAAFFIRDAVLHLDRGIVTVGNDIIKQSLFCFDPAQVPGARWEDNGWLRLPERRTRRFFEGAYHLACCNRHNYAHWMLDGVSRLRRDLYAQLQSRTAYDAPPLCVSALDTAWKKDSLTYLAGPLPHYELRDDEQVVVGNLLYMDDMSGGHFNPDPMVLTAFDTIRQSVYGNRPVTAPHRKVYISRADSPHRKLMNETEIADYLIARGFEVAVLGDLSLERQVMLFAEASHIVAPHGAGLVNLGYCQPGARLCELQMDQYVHVAFRWLSALRGVEYGCLIGQASNTENPEKTHGKSWSLDIKALADVIDSPGFLLPR